MEVNDRYQTNSNGACGARGIGPRGSVAHHKESSLTYARPSAPGQRHSRPPTILHNLLVTLTTLILTGGTIAFASIASAQEPQLPPSFANIDEPLTIFVSREYLGGNFASAAGGGSKALTFATALCTKEANRYNLPGTWYPIISTSTWDAINLTGTGGTAPVYNIKGEIIAKNRHALWSADLSHPVKYEADGGLRKFGLGILTGTTSSGLKASTKEGLCNDWTSNSETANPIIGNLRGTNGAWIESPPAPRLQPASSCKIFRQIYCIGAHSPWSQATPTPTASPTSTRTFTPTSTPTASPIPSQTNTPTSTPRSAQPPNGLSSPFRNSDEPLTIFISNDVLGSDFAKNAVAGETSLALAQRFCSAEARRSNLPGEWYPLLSTSNWDAVNITGASGKGAIYNVKGEVVAQNRAELWNGQLRKAVGYYGNSRPYLHSLFIPIVTGTGPTGLRTSYDRQDYCDDWTSNVLRRRPTTGRGDQTNHAWMQFGVKSSCSGPFRIYCIGAKLPSFPTQTPTQSATPTSSSTPTRTPTQTSTPKTRSTATPTPTTIATNTPTSKPSNSPTPTATRTPSKTVTPSSTATLTAKPSATRTIVPTSTPTPTPTPTLTPSPEPSDTQTPKPSPSATSTSTATQTPQSSNFTATPTPTSTTTKTPTSTTTATLTPNDSDDSQPPQDDTGEDDGGDETPPPNDDGEEQSPDNGSKDPPGNEPDIVQASEFPLTGVDAIYAGEEQTCARRVVEGRGTRFWCWGNGGDPVPPFIEPDPVRIRGVDDSDLNTKRRNRTYIVNGKEGSVRGLAFEVPQLPEDIASLQLFDPMGGLCYLRSGGIGCFSHEGLLGTPTGGFLNQVSSGSGVTGFSSPSAYFACWITGGGLTCTGSHKTGYFSPPVIETRAIFPPGSGVTEVSSGHLYTCAVISGGVKCWGDGPVGIDSYLRDIWRPGPNVPGLEGGVSSVVAGNFEACAVQIGGVKCWDRITGTLPEKSYIPGLGKGSGVTKIVNGWDFWCALIKDGSVKCWGNRDEKAFGLTLKRDAAQSVPGLSTGVTDIAAGRYHLCVVQSGVARCSAMGPALNWFERGAAVRGIGDNEYGRGINSADWANVHGISIMGEAFSCPDIPPGDTYRICSYDADEERSCRSKTGEDFDKRIESHIMCFSPSTRQPIVGPGDAISKFKASCTLLTRQNPQTVMLETPGIEGRLPWSCVTKNLSKHTWKKVVYDGRHHNSPRYISDVAINLLAHIRAFMLDIPVEITARGCSGFEGSAQDLFSFSQPLFFEQQQVIRTLKEITVGYRSPVTVTNNQFFSNISVTDSDIQHQSPLTLLFKNGRLEQLEVLWRCPERKDTFSAYHEGKSGLCYEDHPTGDGPASQNPEPYTGIYTIPCVGNSDKTSGYATCTVTPSLKQLAYKLPLKGRVVPWERYPLR